jgi:hypothetical protein
MVILPPESGFEYKEKEEESLPIDVRFWIIF